MSFVRAAMYEARARGFDLLMMGKGDDELQGDMLADALVVMDVRLDDPRLPALTEIGLPTVLVGYPGEGSTFSSVDLDFQQAGEVAAAHLIDLGHTHIAVVGPPSPQSLGEQPGFTRRFLDGFIMECDARGVRGAVIEYRAGPEGVKDWLASAEETLPELSAIVAAAPGVLEPFLDALQGRGVSIPQDCSVMTVAPAETMRSLDLPITVIDLPGNEMVRRAVNLVLDELVGTAKPGLVELMPAILCDLGSTTRHLPEGSGSVFAPTAQTRT
ncbi:LacI family DNA-binding transcriptional regulator [Arthrobacter sp. D2-10]